MINLLKNHEIDYELIKDIFGKNIAEKINQSMVDYLITYAMKKAIVKDICDSYAQIIFVDSYYVYLFKLERATGYWELIENDSLEINDVESLYEEL